MISGGQHRRGKKTMNKVTKTTPRERTSGQNGMPELVPYVYRQLKRRNDWAARIARRNSQDWSQPPAFSPSKADGEFSQA